MDLFVRHQIHLLCIKYYIHSSKRSTKIIILSLPVSNSLIYRNKLFLV